MKILGFKLVTNEMFSVLMEDSESGNTILSKENIVFPKNQNIPQFTDWSETQFGLLVDRYEPDKIIYKLSPGLEKHDQIFHVNFGLGILNYVAFIKSLEIRPIPPQSLRPTSFGLNRGDKLDHYIKSIFPDEDTPWNANIRDVVSCILAELK